MKILLTIVLTLLAALAIGAGVIHGGGLTNFAGDEPHPAMVNGFIEFARERFIAARSEQIEVPNLDDAQLIADGAAHYAPMCSGCHLGPGTQDTEIRRGLYPQPPNLAQPASHAAGHDHSELQKSAARQFWIIKHGIKMTAMPAWGTTHDDQAIWGLVAFLQKLPDLSPEEYAAMTGQEGAHGTAEATPERHVDPPGAKPHGHGEQPQQKSDEHIHSH
jgi:mono/diheme cytochrome c family protein